MCHDCDRSEKARVEANRDSWNNLLSCAMEANEIYVKIFGGYVKVDKEQISDLLMGMDTRKECPDFDIDLNKVVLFINNVL